MGAREKLNAAHIQGAIILAVLIGGALESVGLAVIIGLMAIGLAYSKGNIR